jgi:hypothetical protein
MTDKTKIDQLINLVQARARAAKLKGFRVPLVACTGLSRQGKDTAAIPLIKVGYAQDAFGRVIKERARSLDDVQVVEMLRWHEREYPDQPHERTRIWRAWLHMSDFKVDPFTEDTRPNGDKERIRALLEWLGMWEYDELLFRFMETLPAPVVNTRLMRVREAEAWKACGGIIVEIIRDGIPRSDFEKQSMEELREGDFIDYVIFNDFDVPTLHASMLSLVNPPVTLEPVK